MPSKQKKPCAYPDCPTLVTGRYCEEHARKVNSDYEKYSRDKGTKEQDAHSIVLVTELVDNELSVQLVADKTVRIIF